MSALFKALAGSVVSLAVAGTTVVGLTSSSSSSAGQPTQPPDPATAAAKSADRLVAADPAVLRAGPHDRFVRQQVTSTPWDLQYVSYERTYRGLPVVGGDFVIVTDDAGNVLGSTVAQRSKVDVAVLPRIGKPRAKSEAVDAVDDGSAKGAPRLVVYAGGKKPVLAWETKVLGKAHGHDGLQNVYVDATSGKFLDSVETTASGTGTGIYNGSGLTIGTTQSGGTYRMADPARPGLNCQDYSTNQVLTGNDDTWGSTSGTDKEAGCVDVLYAAAGEWDMLKNWYGREGLDGQGNWADAEVGLNDENAWWDHPSHNSGGVTFGYNRARNWVTGIDVVGHEYGHGLDANTPGGISGHPSQESVADIWGSLTEHYLDNPNDAPDYEIGEEINLQGNGPIRYMYEPAKISGHPNCYSSSLPSSVHAAAGPMNHWFYLLAEGTSPGNGKPNSPTCNNTTLTGIGHREAGKVFYNAMLSKTSGMTYPKWRVNTLAAAKNLDSSCTLHAKVKAAWAAVSVPAQSGEASCTVTGNDFTMALSPTSGSVEPGSSASTTVSTTVSSGSAQSVTLRASGLPSGASASFDPATLQSGNTSRLTVSTASSTPAGSYDVTVTADGADVDRTATFRLTVGDGSEPPAGVPDIDVEKVKAHVAALQQAADQNGGHRRAGSAGYTASAAYIEDKLEAAGYTVTRQRCTSGCVYPSDNVIADYPGGDPNQVIMLGAHLDGVSSGPGANDNATGSAAILEVALRLAQDDPGMAKHVRFGWWTDEEQGLNGSEFYVNTLTSTELTKIKAYLNFDMVGSVNAGYFVNNITSDTGKVLKAFYDGLNLQPEENTEGAGRSDDKSFKDAGVPTSGVAAGASNRKTSAQAQKWGGTAGSAYDPCYHAACDKYPANVSATVLDRSADAAAYGLWTLAVGGEPSENDFSLSASPASGTVQPGSSVQTTVGTETTSGAAQSVRLSASGLPSGATATFDPTSVTTGSSSRLTIATSASTPAGSYSVTVTGAGEVSRSTTYTLTVSGTSSGTVTVQNPGNQFGFVGFQTFPLQMRATSSSGSPVTFSATGLPPGLSISASGAISGTPTTAGTYSVTVTGVDGTGARGSTTFSWAVHGW
ncbi:M28 family peptidase [Nocardioides speluncae]|uniref:M28 family peptidase n=1 Tax=Nocardioides speluncae TaxID=2670337 RepID=UPI000D68E52E|nr:M28 family peptidase [Nocardioides speluncae]